MISCALCGRWASFGGLGFWRGKRLKLTPKGHAADRFECLDGEGCKAEAASEVLAIASDET